MQSLGGNHLQAFGLPVVRHLAAVGILLLGAVSCAQRQVAPAPSAPVHSFSSAAEANQAIDRVEKESAVIEQRYIDERSACFSRFLTTACLDAALDRRRSALSSLRDLEVQAKAWLRKDRADRRDEALARRRADDARDTQERAQQVKEREAAMERKRLDSEERQGQSRRSATDTVPPGLRQDQRLADPAGANK